MESSSQLQNKIDDIKKRIDILNQQLGRNYTAPKIKMPEQKSIDKKQNQSVEKNKKEQEMMKLKAKLMGVKK